jgi:hypothetical protein
MNDIDTVAIPEAATISEADAELIEAIVQRAERDYGSRVQSDLLRKGLKAAHRAKPIRLADLLNTCRADFFFDVFLGVFFHYDASTDKMRDGWTAQHAEPK